MGFFFFVFLPIKFFSRVISSHFLHISYLGGGRGPNKNGMTRPAAASSSHGLFSCSILGSICIPSV